MTRSTNYDELAGSFDRRYEGDDYTDVERMVLDFAEPGGRVLEVGCGTGHWLALLHAVGAEVSGLDASPEMLHRARAKVPGAELCLGSAERLPWTDAFFDRVLCVNAFHHFPQKREFIAEARRVLASTGALLIVGMDPHTRLDRWWVYEYFEGTLEIDRARFPASQTIRTWMQGEGFDEAVTVVAQHMQRQAPLSKASSGGRLAKSSTSQLAVLSEDEYARGLERIHRANSRLQAQGRELVLSADIRLYATIGRVRA